MKAVILAGGFGTRISEETIIKPKPMVEIGGYPILWHILKMYSAHGINDFIVCLGYKGYVIKEYFANYFLHMSDVTFDMSRNETQVIEKRSEPWRVTLVDTGDTSMTGGRIRRIYPHVKDETAFCCTYGDGVSDINITTLIDFHHQQQTLATLTAVQPPARFGVLGMSGQKVMRFEEKPQSDEGWINGGFFVLSPKVIDRIESDTILWEKEPLEGLARDGQLSAFKHRGFWQPMDTLRDKIRLEELWNQGKAPWKQWP